MIMIWGFGVLGIVKSIIVLGSSSIIVPWTIALS
jgi:hypothetical protein